MSELEQRVAEIEATIGVRDRYEVANQLQDYVDTTTPIELAAWLIREGRAAAKLARDLDEADKRIAELEASRAVATALSDTAAEAIFGLREGNARLRAALIETLAVAERNEAGAYASRARAALTKESG